MRFLLSNDDGIQATGLAVLERVVALTQGSAILVRHHKSGGEDPIARWFEDEYTYGEFRTRGPEMIAVVADKIDS